MRLGEIQAVRIQDIDPRGAIYVNHSWDDRHGMSIPKWNSTRIVPLIPEAKAAIQDLLNFKRWGDPRPTDVLFWGTNRERPLTKRGILQQFRLALGRIGITPEEVTRRNIVFHSWRHTYNSNMRGRVPDEQLRRVTGHKSEAMTDRYDHVQIESLADVLAAQKLLFSAKEQTEAVK
jgi:integrase